MGKDFIFKQQMFNTVSSAFRSALVIGFMSSFHGLLFSQSVHESLRKGDRQYDLDNYKAAEKEYRIAADLKVNNPKALYNLGNTLYQQGNWEDAAQRFAQAASNSNNKIDQANALHNLGNSLLKQRKFKEAVSAFESSLRLRPGDPDSKTNLQMAKKKLREEDQQKKEQQQKQQNNQDNKQDPNQPNGQQPPQNQPDKQPQQPKEQPPQNQPGQEQQPQQQEQHQPQPGKMKKEEAQRLLETAVGPDDQRNARKYRSARQQNKPKGSKKDW